MGDKNIKTSSNKFEAARPTPSKWGSKDQNEQRVAFVIPFVTIDIDIQKQYKKLLSISK